MTKTLPTIRWGLIDRAVALISPQAASQRYAARIALGNLRRAYDGSAKGRGTDGWTTSGKAADAEIGMAAPEGSLRPTDNHRHHAQDPYLPVGKLDPAQYVH